MKFDFITVYITDMERSLGFYHGLLGLEIVRRAPIEDGELAFLGVQGQPTIELISREAHRGNTYTGFSIGMDVESLEELTKKLAGAGHPVIRGPVSPNPGLTFSFVRDPDGVEIQLTERK